MTRADELLRQTINDLAGEALAVDDLAQGALAKGRRLRLRRRLTVAGGALVAIAALLVPVAVFKGSDAPMDPAASPSVSIRLPALNERTPVELANGWMVAGAGNWILDRGRGRYIQLELPDRKHIIVPAPTGGLAAIATFDDSNRYEIDFAGPRDTSPWRAAVPGNGRFQWSPDGRLLLASLVGPRGAVGFAIIDHVARDVATYWIDAGKYDCSVCEFVWMRDGREVAMAVADRQGGEAHEYVSNVQLFDARTGTPTRSLPMKAMFDSPYSWSPSGRYVICRPDGLKHEYQLLDVTTGEVKPFPFDAVWVSDDVLLALDRPADTSLEPRVRLLWRDGKPIRGYTFTLEGAFKSLGAVTFGPPA